MSDRSTPHGTKRVYKYVDQFGTEFWSFAKLPQRVFRQLTLETLRGDHFRRHIQEIQKEALGLNDESSE